MATLGQLIQWILCIIFLSHSCQAYVPKIEECQYIDAAALECWWKRPRDSDVEYSLEYKNLARPKPYPLERCSPNKITVNSQGEEIESCSVPGVTMYLRFHLNLTTVCPNTTTTWNCSKEYSKEIHFRAADPNVVLRTPPQNLKIEKNSRLVWDNPQVSYSYLTYVYKYNKVAYKVMLKRLEEGEDANAPVDDSWTELDAGSKRSFVLSGLIPGKPYVARVCMALVQPAKDLIWSLPSEPVQFHSSRAIVRTVPHFHATPGTTAVEDPGKTESPLRKRLILVISLPVLSLLILTIVCYILVCGPCSLCPTNVKIPRPFLMITMTEEDNREDYIQDDFDSDKEAEMVPLSTQILAFPPANDNSTTPTTTFGTSDAIRLLCQNERYVENGHHQRSLTAAQENNTSPRVDHANENTPLLQNGSLPVNLCTNGTVGSHLSNGNVTALCNGTDRLSHENEIKNTPRLSTHKHNTRDTGNDLNCKEASRHLDETPHQPLETVRLCPDVPHEQDGKKNSFHFDRSKCSDESQCMDYVIDSSMSFPVNADVMNEEYILGKRLEEAKQGHLLHSESKEKIPDYVTQTTCLGRNANEQMVMFVGSPKDSVTGSLNNKSVSAYAEATEKMRHLLEHMQAQKTCPFCMKNSATIPSSSGSECESEDSNSYQVTRIEALCSDTSSLDSGYSPDSTTST